MAGSKRTLWLILGLGLGVPLLAVLLYGTFVGFEVEPEPGDRDRVLTVDDLGLLDADSDAGHETLVRTRYIDWTTALEYEYEDDEGLYLYCLHSREHSERDARTVYVGQKAGGSLIATTFEEGVELVERPELFGWGEQHSARVIMVDGVEAGYYVDARQGKHVFSVVVTGVLFESGGLDDVLVAAFERAIAKG